jgi:diguanylate cyclase (GGDEF)-like protein
VPKPLVLVADDSATIRALVRYELESGGYDVVEATDGPAALAVTDQHAVDVVLLDIQMPGPDGHAVLAQLKAREATRDVPVVFLSGNDSADDVVQALREGAHDYLRKPPDPAELQARVASAYRMKQLQDQLRERAVELESISRTDHLTGLYNRRHGEEYLRRALAFARRSGQPVTVLLIDVDHFKQVNDTRGHSGGDDVLFEVAQALSSVVRTEDVIARWGGEEFFVCAHRSDLAAAGVLAERLRAAVAARCDVTVSIGAAVSSGDDTDLLETADRNLYAAKAAGRDRCVLAASTPTRDEISEGDAARCSSAA